MSRARLADPEALRQFVSVLGHYSGVVPLDRPHIPSQLGWLQLLPLVFGLVPRDAVFSSDPTQLMLPIIDRHLASLGVQDPPPELRHVLRELAQQMRAAHLGTKTKFTLSQILGRSRYRRLMDSQNGRCATCGAHLESLPDTKAVHLDHIVPWRIAGDPPSGQNWQLLCARCNIGKGEFLSSMQTPESWNWTYGRRSQIDAGRGRIGLRLRWVVLAERGACEVAGCSASSRDADLEVHLESSTGLAVADHLVVACSNHPSGPSS